MKILYNKYGVDFEDIKEVVELNNRCLIYKDYDFINNAKKEVWLRSFREEIDTVFIELKNFFSLEELIKMANNFGNLNFCMISDNIEIISKIGSRDEIKEFTLDEMKEIIIKKHPNIEGLEEKAIKILKGKLKFYELKSHDKENIFNKQMGF